MTRRRCAGERPDGHACRANPVTDSDFCLLHDPERAEEVAASRRLGGLRRRREATVVAAYDLAALDTPVGIRRILEIAVADALGLDNGVARLRVLLAGAATAIRLFEATELDARIRALETLHRRDEHPQAGSLLDGPDQ